MQVTQSRLGKVNRGRMTTPFKAFIYGIEAVGKTSVAAATPSPIFFDLEDGTARMDVARYTFHDGAGGYLPRSYQDVLDGIEDLIRTPSPYETLVIDSVSALEPLIWRHILARDSGGKSEMNPSGRQLASIESYGYGKGYQMAMEEGKAFLAALDRLRATRGMNVLLVGHAHVKNFRNPSGEDYDRFTPRLNEKLAGKIIEWADLVGFAMFEEGALGKEGKGISTGRRLMYFSRKASWDAKSRYALPEYLEIVESDPWSKIGAAIMYADTVTSEQLLADIKVALERIGDAELSKKVNAAISALPKGHERERLAVYLNRLNEKAGVQ